MSSRIVVLAILLLAKAPKPGVPAAEVYFPPPETEGGWRSIIAPNATPSEREKLDILKKTGFDWDGLRRAWDYDLKMVGPDAPKSLLIIRRGWIAFEQYDANAGNYTKDTRVRFASGTKSLVGVSMARLFSEKKCRDTDSLYRYLPSSWAENEPERREIQIRHVLSMSSGLEPYDGPYEAETYGQIIANLGVIAKPGTLWWYNTGALDLINYVIADLSGKSMEDYLNSEILRPIGGGKVAVQPRHKFGGHGFCSFYEITPRDYARIGYLLLRGGQWGGKQLIEKSVVSLVTSLPPWLPEAEVGESGRKRDRPQEHYAYTFWLNRTGLIPALPPDAYMASGGNHKMIVVPSLDTVIVRVGNYVHDSAPVNRVYGMIRESLKEVPLRAGAEASTSAPPPAAPSPAPAPSGSVSLTEFKTVPSGAHLEIEAESGICVPPMTVGADPGDPSTKYVWTPRQAPPNFDQGGGPAKAALAFHVPRTQAYSIWIRTIAPDSRSDSYILALDGSVMEQPWHTQVIPQSKDWRWTRIRKGRVIEAGSHVLEFRHRESGIKLDKVIITSDPDYVP